MADSTRDRRLELMVGYSCNNNCIFCYVHNKRKKDMDKTTKELKKDIYESRQRGTTEIAFLGGEPTIRKDIFELVRFASQQGFREIKLTTNGRMLSYPEFVDKLVENGITKALFSIHGSKPEIHDKQTRVKGSFEQIMQGIRNVKRHHNVIIETNSTITKENYFDLPNMANLFVECKMLSSEIIFMFPEGGGWQDVSQILPRYSECRPYMEKAIEIGKNSDTHILMRYVPYCILPNHINYIADQFDPAEREQVGTDVHNLDVIKVRRELDRAQVEECKGCKYNNVCEGPWKRYPKVYGTSEFKKF